MHRDAPQEEEDDQYASSQDSDFAPEDAPAVASDNSDSDDAPSNGHAKRKQRGAENGTRDDNYDNSGDEAIIAKGQRKRRRAREKGLAADEDEGGHGGLVKTRAQRAAEKEEREYTATSDPVTIDVDALWAQMISGESAKPSTADESTDKAASSEPTTLKEQSATESANDSSRSGQTDVIRIKRTYNFAGKVHTEEKLVARDSAEAKLYLASEGNKAVSTEASPSKRATRKAFRSAFEPILDQGPGRTDLDLGLAARMKAAKDMQAKKLNTVEKSRMDWAGYVDKEGIQDELQLASKSKDSYAARQDFLARSEAIREDDARKARMAGKT